MIAVRSREKENILVFPVIAEIHGYWRIKMEIDTEITFIALLGIISKGRRTAVRTIPILKNISERRRKLSFENIVCLAKS